MTRDLTETVNEIRRQAPHLLNKTSEQILDDWDNGNKKRAYIYIHALTLALVLEDPLIPNIELRKTVYRLCRIRKVCSQSLVFRYFPDWTTYKSRKKVYPITNLSPSDKIEIETLNQSMSLLARTDSKLPQPIETKYDEEERKSKEEREKTWWEYYGDVNEAQAALWNALTNEEHMPGAEEDLIVDHIKPTRVFWKNVCLALGSMERQGLLRRCNELIAILEDRAAIVEDLERNET